MNLLYALRSTKLFPHFSYHVCLRYALQFYTNKKKDAELIFEFTNNSLGIFFKMAVWLPLLLSLLGFSMPVLQFVRFNISFVLLQFLTALFATSVVAQITNSIFNKIYAHSQNKFGGKHANTIIYLFNMFKFLFLRINMGKLFKQSKFILWKNTHFVKYGT